MHEKIQALANLLRDKRKSQGKQCVVMLGAGASLSSGVPRTDQLMDGLLKLHRTDLVRGTLRDRFDEMWRNLDADTRDLYLKDYLELRPKPGYQRLAELLRDGYFDIVVTFNFDLLLETALGGVMRPEDFAKVVRGEYHSDTDVRRTMDLTRPRVKILKPHGGLKGGDTFLFSREEMDDYREEIKSLLRELTRRDILVCGYAFQDECVRKAFSPYGGLIFWVNPSGAPPSLDSFLRNRNSSGWVFDGELGYFDTFFGELHEALTGSATRKPKANPFKFLLSYDVGDQRWFFGRTWLTRKVVREFQDAPPKALHLLGPPKAGKTSFVRAGLIANLDARRFHPEYLRCQGALQSWLPKALSKSVPGAEKDDAKTALRRLAQSTGKHLVVVLDQFERVVNCYPDTPKGLSQLAHCLSDICDCAGQNLTFVCVGTEDARYFKALTTARLDFTPIPAPEARVVGGIIGRMFREAKIAFEPAVIQAIMKQYDEARRDEQNRKPEDRFTLAHVQALCHILSDAGHVDLAGYQRAWAENKDALNMALNVCDIVSFVEDIPEETGRNLFRKLMKLIPVETKKVLAEHGKTYGSDLITPPEYEEAT